MGTTHSQADIAASMAAVGSLLKITRDKASGSAVGRAELEPEFLALSASRLNGLLRQHRLLARSLAARPDPYAAGFVTRASGDCKLNGVTSETEETPDD